MADSVIGTAAVMFTDLVGSTELRMRIGEEAAEVVRSQHDRLVSRAVDSGGGGRRPASCRSGESQKS